MFLPPFFPLDEDELDDFGALGYLVAWLVGNVAGFGFGVILAHLVALCAVSATGVSYDCVFGPAAVVLVISAEIGCAALAGVIWFADESEAQSMGCYGTTRCDVCREKPVSPDE